MKEFLQRRSYPSPHIFLSPLETQHKRHLSRFGKMAFSYCDGWYLFFTCGRQQLPAPPHPLRQSLPACGDAPATPWNKGAACLGLNAPQHHDLQGEIEKKERGKN